MLQPRANNPGSPAHLHSQMKISCEHSKENKWQRRGCHGESRPWLPGKRKESCVSRMLSLIQLPAPWPNVSPKNGHTQGKCSNLQCLVFFKKKSQKIKLRGEETKPYTQSSADSPVSPHMDTRSLTGVPWKKQTTSMAEISTGQAAQNSAFSAKAQPSVLICRKGLWMLIIVPSSKWGQGHSSTNANMNLEHGAIIRELDWKTQVWIFPLLRKLFKWPWGHTQTPTLAYLTGWLLQR